MAQGACNSEGPREPFTPKGAASQNMTVFLQGNLTLHWASGTHEDYAAATTTITTTGGTQHVDARTTTWLIATFEGAGQLYFIDLHAVLSTGLDSIFTTSPFTGTAKNWAILAWIEGTSVFLFPQGASSFPGTPIVLDPTATPAEGDILVFRSGKWEVLDPAAPGQVLMTHGVSSDPDYQTIATVLLYLLTTSGDSLVNNGGTIAREPLPGTAPATGKVWAWCSITGTSVGQWQQVAL